MADSNNSELITKARIKYSDGRQEEKYFGVYPEHIINDIPASRIIGIMDMMSNIDADKITSGVLNVNRIPNLNANKITEGTLNPDRIPTLNTNQIPNLSADKITSGVLNVNQIPSLNANKITEGTLNENRIPTLSANKIPNLDANKITTGTFTLNRIPVLSVDKIPDLDASKITTGTLDKARMPSDLYITSGRKSGSTLGTKATTEGYNTTASGSFSHAEGHSTTASGDHGSHAEGWDTRATHWASHAEGCETKATDNFAHAEGYGTVAGSYSHAEGYYTEAIKTSHAEGTYSTASGDCSHAEGHSTTASGDYSHAGGYATIAGYTSQTVIGVFNNNKQNTLFEIGYGNEYTRKNAFEVYKTGQININEAIVQSSDRNVKKEISYIGENSEYKDTNWSNNEIVNFIDSLKPVIYKMKDNGIRPHHGLIAQDVEENLSNLNKDHAVLIKTPVSVKVQEEITDEETGEVKTIEKDIIPENPEYSYGLRYDELISDLVKYCQLLKQKVIDLENEVKTLKLQK